MTMEGMCFKRSLNMGSRGLVVALAMFALFAEVSGLKCYQCRGYMTNEECNLPENLKPCPETSALVYDVCESLVKTTDKGKEIRKVCAKGPCSLETHNQNSALNIAQECSGDSCRFCCSKDGCNIDGALSSMRSSMFILLLPSILTVCIISWGWVL